MAKLRHDRANVPSRVIFHLLASTMAQQAAKFVSEKHKPMNTQDLAYLHGVSVDYNQHSVGFLAHDGSESHSRPVLNGKTGSVIVSDDMTTISKFEIRNNIAMGSASQIYEVVEQGTSNQYAMKLLLPDAFAEREQKAILKHEFKVGKALDHPSIIKMHEFEQTRDHCFILMDYFRAPSLKSQATGNRTKAQSMFKKVAESMTLALQYMHENGWLHRDIKPDNILVNNTGEAKLIDFSLSSRTKKGVGKFLAGKAKSIQGTRTYIAPETLLKKQPTEQTDLYSLGVAFYEVLTGIPPFAGTSPNDLCIKHLSEKPAPPSFANDNITPEADMLILRMLAKKPAERHESMQELYQQLRTLKVWHSDPLQLAEEKRKEEEIEAAQSVDQRLDSRADAKRKAMGIAAPAKHKNKKKKILLKDVIAKEEKEKAGAGTQPATPAPAAQPPMQQPPQMYPPPQQQPMYPPQQQPMYPPQQQPMYMPPPQQPMYMPPAAQMPPGYPQQMPAPPQPPQQLPPQPLQPPQHQAPIPQPGAPPQMPPPVQPPAAPRPPAQQPVIVQPIIPRETQAPIGSPLRRAEAPKPVEKVQEVEELEEFTSLDDFIME